MTSHWEIKSWQKYCMVLYTFIYIYGSIIYWTRNMGTNEHTYLVLSMHWRCRVDNRISANVSNDRFLAVGNRPIDERIAVIEFYVMSIAEDVYYIYIYIYSIICWYKYLCNFGLPITIFFEKYHWCIFKLCPSHILETRILRTWTILWFY